MSHTTIMMMMMIIKIISLYERLEYMVLLKTCYILFRLQYHNSPFTSTHYWVPRASCSWWSVVKFTTCSI